MASMLMPTTVLTPRLAAWMVILYTCHLHWPANAQLASEQVPASIASAQNATFPAWFYWFLGSFLALLIIMVVAWLCWPSDVRDCFPCIPLPRPPREQHVVTPNQTYWLKLTPSNVTQVNLFYHEQALGVPKGEWRVGDYERELPQGQSARWRGMLFLAHGARIIGDETPHQITDTDMMLTFKNGKITGYGRDEFGRFSVKGIYKLYADLGDTVIAMSANYGHFKLSYRGVSRGVSFCGDCYKKHSGPINVRGLRAIKSQSTEKGSFRLQLAPEEERSGFNAHWEADTTSSSSSDEEKGRARTTRMHRTKSGKLKAQRKPRRQAADGKPKKEKKKTKPWDVIHDGYHGPIDGATLSDLQREPVVSIQNVAPPIDAAQLMELQPSNGTQTLI